jgi:hypothetical protein
MGLQSCGSPNFGNFGTHNLGILGQNDIWVQAPWPTIKNTIKGKVVASPKFETWWVLWVGVCSWFIRAWKMLQLHTNNLLFGLCKFVWIIDPLVIHPSSHPRALARPLTCKVLQAKECTSTPYPLVVFTFRLASLSLWRSLGVHHTICIVH